MSGQSWGDRGNNAQAVIVEKNGKIEYYNEAAARLIPGIETAAPEDIFPAELLSHIAAQFFGEIEIGGKNMVVNVTSEDACRVYSIKAGPPQEQGDWDSIFETISYELNNHLSVLKMASGLLLPYVENQDNPRLFRYASMIYHSYYSIQRITNNLKDFGEFIQNGLTLKRSPFDLIASCAELLDSARHLVSDRGVELRFESSLDSLIVYADKARLDKLILNLLSNSLLNTPSGGAIYLTVALAGDRFILTVTDNGRGIPPDIVQTAWCRYRTGREPADQRVGIGLGLPIVHAIAKEHGGSVMLESKQGKGTTVTVSIPQAEPATTAFRNTVVEYDGRDMQQLLTELSDVIGFEKYSQKYMD